MRRLTLLFIVLACGCQPRATPSTQPLSQSAPKLVAGLGAVHHAVCTANADAQKYFDQGLAYLYGFNHEAAVRSFEYAGRLDPNLAMAYWGKALALGPNINAAEMDQEAAKGAYEAVRRAEALASHATVAERGYIAALSKRYAESP